MVLNGSVLLMFSPGNGQRKKKKGGWWGGTVSNFSDRSAAPAERRRAAPMDRKRPARTLSSIIQVNERQ